MNTALVVMLETFTAFQQFAYFAEMQIGRGYIRSERSSASNDTTAAAMREALREYSFRQAAPCANSPNICRISNRSRKEKRNAFP
jgi:hypothetical protein